MKQKQDRRRTPSVFFILLKASVKTLAAIVFLLWLELWSSGLFPIWKEALSYPILWAMPVLFGLTVFLDTLVRRQWKSLALWSGCFLLILCILVRTAFQPSAQFLQLHMRRGQSVERQAQKLAPAFEHTLRQQTCEVPLYFENRQMQPVIPAEEQLAIAAMINAFPPALKENVSGVYFLSPETFQEKSRKLWSEELTGYAEMESGTIVIKVWREYADRYIKMTADGRMLSLQDPECYQETLVHEFSHLLDICLTGSTAFLSDRQDWIDLYTRNPGLLGEYAMSKPGEYFAETGVYYFLYPDLLRQMSPELYQWYDQNALHQTAADSQDAELFSLANASRHFAV